WSSLVIRAISCFATRSIAGAERLSPSQGEVDDVQPRKETIDDRPENRVVCIPRDRDSERRAEAHARLGEIRRPNGVLWARRLAVHHWAGVAHGEGSGKREAGRRGRGARDGSGLAMRRLVV